MMMWPLPDDGSLSGGRQRFPATDDPDVRLTYQVAERLLSDARTRHQKVTVEVQNRVVLLSGTVDGHEAGQAAVDTVRQVPGVTDICNALRVAPAGNGHRGGPAGGTAGADQFQRIVTELRSEDPARYRTDDGPPRRRVVLWAVVVTVAWALLSWLMVVSAWTALALGCSVIALTYGVTRHRRQARAAAARTGPR